MNESYEALQDRFLFDPILRVLRELGPIRFAEQAIARGDGGRLRAKYAGPCDLCAHIASDVVLENHARESALRHRAEWAGKVIRGLRSASRIRN